MINYWNELVNYKQKRTKEEIRKQIQKEIVRYMGRADVAAKDLCQIVEDNFKELK